MAGNFFDQFDSAEPASAPAPARSRYADAISTVESGGNYREIGPHTGSMGRALGKYQVMSANVGPWSKEVLGREVTPQEFINDPKLQDAVFEGKFGQYVQKYGPDGAARAWFAGEKGMKNPNAKDAFGTTVDEYSRRFNKALGPQDATAAVRQFAPDQPDVMAFAPQDKVSQAKPAAKNFFDQFDEAPPAKDAGPTFSDRFDAVNDKAAFDAVEVPKKKFGIEDTWPAKLAKSVYEAVTLPGEGYQGKLSAQPEKPGWITEGDIANQDAIDREIVRRSFDLAGVATPATVASKAVSAAAPAAKALTEGQKVVQAADRLGVDLPRAVTSDKTAVQQMGKVVTSVPIGGTPLRKASQQAIEQIGQKADELQSSLGSGEASVAGQAAREGIENYVGKETQRTADALYSKVDETVNPTVTTPLVNTAQKVNTISGRRTLAAMGDSPAAANVAEALSRPEGLTYEGIKQLRTSIGEMLKGGPLPGNISQSELKQIYNGLSADLKASVRNAGGERAASLFERANRYYDLVSDRRENLARILNAKSDEGLFSKIVSSAGSTSSADSKLLVQARKAVSPEDWNEIGSAVIGRLGRDAEGNFTPDRFATAWGKLSEQGKSLLFSKEHRAALNDIATISSRFKQLNQFANPSGTGQTVAGVAGLGGVFVDPVSLLGGIVSSRVLSGLLAKPATTRTVSRWSKAYESAVRAPSKATSDFLKRETQSFSASIANVLGAPQLARDLSRAIQGAVPAGASDKDEKA
jgi:hypothetical protein